MYKKCFSNNKKQPMVHNERRKRRDLFGGRGKRTTSVHFGMTLKTWWSLNLVARHTKFFGCPLCWLVLPRSRTDHVDVEIGHIKLVPGGLLRYGGGGGISGRGWPGFRLVFAARRAERADKVQIIGQPIAQRFAAAFRLARLLLNIASAVGIAGHTGAGAGVVTVLVHLDDSAGFRCALDAKINWINKKLNKKENLLFCCRTPGMCVCGDRSYLRWSSFFFFQDYDKLTTHTVQRL